MSDWTNGYVSEIDYTYGYYREISPAHLRFCLLTRSIRPPQIDKSNFTYCELGFGQGFSLNIHAVTNSTGTFWGTDFNPNHATWATQLAEAAGSTNIHIADNSFAELLARDDLPDFDFIVLHGIYSWISEENRRTIVEFIRRKLKVGGAVYNSYNTLPGWAAAMPLRELMTLHAADSAGDTTSRIDKALEFAKSVQDAGAGYFGANPQIGPRLERLQGMSRNYLAHEYFNRDWTPMYHADVAREFSDAKLTFAASATLSDQIDIVNINTKGLEVLNTTTNPLMRETLRDFFMNQQFRRDIFTRGSARITAHEQIQLMRETRFALMVPRATIPTSVNFPVGKVDMKQEIYAPILDRLAKGPATFGTIVDETGLATMPFSALLQAMMVICSQNWATACLDAAGDKTRKVATKRLNQEVLKRAVHSATLNFMASPVTGGGIPVDRLHQLFILAQDSKQDPIKVTMNSLKMLNQSLIKDGKPLTEEADALAELNERFGKFTADFRPLYEQLGLI